MNSTLEALPVFPAAENRSSGARNASHRLAEHMEIGGHNVRIDVFEPAEGGYGRTILLLHGVGGLLGDGGLMWRAARAFAAHGCHACIVHYFNTTGTFFATPAQVREHAEAWRSGIAEAARHYAGLHREPVGVLGYSLGGVLAVAAAEETADIGAIAVFCGGLCEEHERQAHEHLPPLLVLHGAQDARVPLDRADALVRVGRDAGALVESVVYPKEGHSFGASAERDALERAAEFFDARLETGA